MIKKSALIISLVLVLSFLLSSCNEKNGIDKIEIADDGMKNSEVWGDYVTVEADEDGMWRYQISCRLYPEDSENPGIRFEYDEAAEGVSVSESGEVIFTEPGMITVYAVLCDGSNKTDSITVIALQ